MLTAPSRAFALALLVMTLASCRDDPPPPARYVALGSSFAAGTGIEPVLSPCDRSARSYPHLVAQQLHLTLDDLTCAGGTSRDVLDRVDSIDPTTALVTVTVGGNDIGYTATATECAAGHCEPDAPDTRALRQTLTAALDEIAARAPAAEIVVVTYPRLVPRDGAACDALGLDAAETTAVGELGRRLENALLAAATAAGATLVDPYSLPGHDVCSSTPWVIGAPAGGAVPPFHPNAAGHAAMAALVVDGLRAR